MRKLKLQVQTTIDGFISGPNNEMDWLTLNWGGDIIAYVKSITEPVDTILLGKNLAMGFIPHWTTALQQPEPEDGAQKFVETPKLVFSSTLNAADPLTADWPNTDFINGDLVEEINKIKNKAGGDIMVYGGGKFVSSLISAQLIDELHLFVNPAIIGRGMPIFQSIKEMQKYKCAATQHFDCGIVVLQYHLL